MGADTVTTGNGSTKVAPQKAGLEDIIAGTSNICFLDGKRGLLAYYGYDIHDLVKGNFEETAYLLFYGALPNAAQLKEFSAKLVAARALPTVLRDRLAAQPMNIHPMAVVRTLVSALSFYDNDVEDLSREATIEKGIRLMAQI